MYVAGAVAHPGLYRLPAGSRVGDAVALAGGLAAGADAVAVNLAARISDGDEVAVFHVGEAPARVRTR
ncbi:MAG: SLBB domain-containing protein, partial [Candidatus Eremiobacteraeota bacterium]|nr:SLBB domain-containing protein [Candidatus Eremiobacteraeota bacterium]